MVFEEGKRKWQPREMLMTSEFIAKMFPGKRYATRVRVGMPHPELVFEGMEAEELRLLRVYSRWVDGIVYLPDRLILIEVKIRSQLAGLAALELYERLIRKDPEFEEYRRKPIEKWLVYGVEDTVVNELAKEKGIKTQQYVPEWLPNYLQILAARERRAPLTRYGE